MKIELAKLTFLTNLASMKKVLDLGEYKLDEKSFRYYKKQIMDIFFNSLKEIFKQLEQDKIIKRCHQKCSLRNGYSDCLCGGSGWINN